jgi:hypothetical protein
MKSILSSLFFLFFIASPAVHAQTYRFFKLESFAVHAIGNVSLHSYSAKFSAFQGSTVCSDFTSGSGTGLGYGLNIELPIHNSLAVTLGCSMNNRNGKLNTKSEFPVRNINQSGMITVTTDNQIEATLPYLDIQPDIRFNVIEYLNFIARGFTGIVCKIPMSPSFVQTESIVSPESAVFVNNGNTSQSRVLASGPINSSSIAIGATFGAETMIRIAPSIHITQHIMYEIPLSDIVSDVPWKISGFRCGLGLRYSFRKFNPTPNMP